MHVKSLKVFCDVVGQRSFSRTADDNGLTQSGVSQVVHQLEQRLGVKLIDRSKRPWVLTAEGEVYYQGCRKFVQRYYALEEEVRTLHQEVAGRVRVASIYSVGMSHMKDCVEKFTQLYPQVHVEWKYYHPDKVYELVERDSVELGLVSYPKSSRTIDVMSWREEPIVMVCSPQHPLACKSVVTTAELDDVRLVSFDHSLTIRRKIDRFLADHHCEVQVVMDFDSIENIKRAIEIDSGVGLLPEPTVAGEVANGTLVALPIVIDWDGDDDGANGEVPRPNVGEPVLTRPLGIIYRKGAELTVTARRFISELQKHGGESDREGKNRRQATVRN